MRYFTIFAFLCLSALPGVGQALGLVDSKDAAPFIVCVDPGHPSETSPGARVGKLSERKINWQVAQALSRRLRALGIRFVLTKAKENLLVTNRRRAEIANQVRASLFLRLHCDVGVGSGFTLYYPNKSATIDGVTGPSRDVQNASADAARIVNTAMAQTLKGILKANPIRPDSETAVGRKQGGALTGSIHSHVPTVLVELAFLNRKADARFLASEKGRNRMADALAHGVEAYKLYLQSVQGAADYIGDSSRPQD